MYIKHLIVSKCRSASISFMEDRPGLSIKRAELAMISAKERALAAFGLTVSQYCVLRVLLDLPGAPGAELSRHCLVTPQAITTVLANLEQRDLIQRRPHPYHRSLREVHLTKEGRRLVVRADKAALDVEARLVADLSQHEIDELQRVLQHCTDNLAAPAARNRLPVS